jgi:threonine/homoserine/homoserine lactone efflux protein
MWKIMYISEFLMTSLIVVLMPGTGVIYCVSIGISRGSKASLFAAVGCTLGILPHLLATVLGLAAILHASALAFQIFKWLGVLYLLYLAWSMWKDSGRVQLSHNQYRERHGQIAVRAFLINILNPKLSIFFLAFLPQFIPVAAPSPVSYMLAMSAVFMLMTLVVFVCYGMLANQVRHTVSQSPRLIQIVQRCFAGLFVGLGFKLSVMER